MISFNSYNVRLCDDDDDNSDNDCQSPRDISNKMNVVRLAGNNGEGEVLTFATQSPRASVNFAPSGSGSVSASSTAPPTTSTAPTSCSRGSINLDRRSNSNSNSNDNDGDDVALMEGGTSTDALIFKSK